MKSIDHIQKQRQEVEREYNDLTKKILTFFKNDSDPARIILEMNAFIDTLYAQYEELTKEHINTLLSSSSSEEGALNNVFEQYMNGCIKNNVGKEAEDGKE